MADVWIVIPNWERFQHYRNRSPVWIKLYTGLAHKPEWLKLSDADKGFLVTIWLEYALAHGNVTRTQLERISNDERTKDARRMFVKRSLERLNDAGFIELSASKPLARRYQRASAEVEVLRTSTKERASRKAARKGGRLSSAEQEQPSPRVELSGEQLAAIRAENIARAAALRDRFH